MKNKAMRKIAFEEKKPKVIHLSYSQLKGFLYQQGIKVVKCTRKYIHIETDREDFLKNYEGTQLPNTFSKHRIMDSFYTEAWSGHKGTLITLREAVDQNQKIMCIKIIRSITGLGLKEAKDLVDHNYEEWKAFPDYQLVDQTPEVNLPLLIANMKTELGKTYLEKKLKG